MYFSKDGPKIRRHGADAGDAMYILGMTLWQLWTFKHPLTEETQLNCVRNPAARSLIDDCVKPRFRDIIQGTMLDKDILPEDEEDELESDGEDEAHNRMAVHSGKTGRLHYGRNGLRIPMETVKASRKVSNNG